MYIRGIWNIVARCTSEFTRDADNQSCIYYYLIALYLYHNHNQHRRQALMEIP